MRFTALAAVVHATAHRRLFFNSLQVLEWFRAKGLEAYSISCGQSLLYNNIFPKHKASTRLHLMSFLPQLILAMNGRPLLLCST